MSTNTPTARTNLTRTQAQWRSDHLRLEALEVTIDLTGAGDEPGFNVASVLSVQVRVPCEGAWVDFLGEEVRSLTVDGAATPVEWDGARLTLPPLAPGAHRIEVDARGTYSHSGQGLHCFQDPVDGATYLYTHFEPSDARRAWPCMDQPNLKAPFTLTVVHPESWTILANGLPESTRPSGYLEGAAVTTFAPTRPLPSYLTALAAGPWHRVEGEWRSSLREEAPVPISWSCRASLAEHLDADELLEITRAGMDLYDRTYAYPYPWGSYDSVLVPEYNIGAMENPGCVTFNEDAYLFQGPATRAQHGARANTILHEMCHMWFGDLVTPRWWEDTWLKESFADHQGTWAQAEATQWKEAWATFALGRKAWAYAEDSRPATTHPIVATVEDVEAARQTFDGITYAKGAAVLKQLVAYLGQDTFESAAQQWFREHAFGNATLADFLDTLSRASGRDMNSWAQAWLHTSGPSILTPEVEHDGSRIIRLTLTQEGTDPATGTPVLRPHHVLVGLYSFSDAGALVRTASLPVSMAGEDGQPVARVDLEAAVGLPAPDLVTVNDEDLTYAVVRPDPASLAVARTSLARLADPLARAVWWSSLDNLVRDGLLSPRVYSEMVLSQADDSTQPAVLATLLQRARHYAVAYTAQEDRAEALAPLITQGWEHLAASEAGSDAQLVRARAWIEALGQAGLCEAAVREVGLAHLEELAAGALDGLELSEDLRWRILIARARLGLATETEIAAARAADPSATGATRALQAVSSLPTPECKEKTWERILTDTSVSNDHLDALIAGFHVDGHLDLTAAYTPRYLAALEEVWSSTSQEMATRIVSGLFPSSGSKEDLAAVRSWLAAHEQAPTALRRLVLKAEDDLARAVRARTPQENR